MTGFLGRPSVRGIRWIARILGTLIGLLLLGESIEWLTGSNAPAKIPEYLGAVGLVMIVVGFAVGWFKDLAASLLVLGGSVLFCVIALLPPGGEWPWPIFVVTGLLGLLFLYVHLAGKKK